MTPHRIARVCHEANRGYCAATGDASQAPWDECPDWQRDSAIAGVKAVMANPLYTPEDSHQTWYDHKVATGWHYGPEKDADRKTHPCMVPYHKLPDEQKAKDALFVAVVRALM